MKTKFAGLIIAGLVLSLAGCVDETITESKYETTLKKIENAHEESNTYIEHVIGEYSEVHEGEKKQAIEHIKQLIEENNTNHHNIILALKCISSSECEQYYRVAGVDQRIREITSKAKEHLNYAVEIFNSAFEKSKDVIEEATEKSKAAIEEAAPKVFNANAQSDNAMLDMCLNLNVNEKMTMSKLYQLTLIAQYKPKLSNTVESAIEDYILTEQERVQICDLLR